MTDLINLYNPANAGSLSETDREKMQLLSSDDIKQLAMAYPNMTMQRAYLLIVDDTKPAGKQLPTLSSFENLWNLREKNGLRNYVAFGFKGQYKVIPARLKNAEVLDLSDTELMDLPGFSTATTEHPAVAVPVTKVNKKAKTKTV
jgi:hypothetical protein